MQQAFVVLVVADGAAVVVLAFDSDFASRVALLKERERAAVVATLQQPEAALN